MCEDEGECVRMIFVPRFGDGRSVRCVRGDVGEKWRRGGV